MVGATDPGEITLSAEPAAGVRPLVRLTDGCAGGHPAGDVIRTVTIEIDRFRSFDPDYVLRYPGRGMQLSTSVELPVEIDPEGAEASIDRTGTLSVQVPKRSPTTAVSVDEASSG